MIVYQSETAELRNKTRILFCLKAMSTTDDNETLKILENFDNSIDEMGLENWKWIADRLVDGDDKKHPENFELWRENLYAQAITGDLKAKSHKEYLESLGLGLTSTVPNNVSK